MNSARATTSPTPLGARLHALLRDARWRDSFRALFDAEFIECRLGWPRMVQRAQIGEWLRRSDVLVELARAPAQEPFALALALHAESATRLVDRLLGGQGSSGAASASSKPSEAECGVLAYAAARLCGAAAQTSWLVRDVRRAFEPDQLSDGALVVWPLSARTSFGSIEAIAALAPTLAASFPELHSLQIGVCDHVDPSAIAKLARGDVLVSDRWALTSTTEGLAGAVELALDGTETRLSALLSQGRLHARAPAPALDPAQLVLVLARLGVSLAELAELAAGVAFPIAPHDRELVSLEQRGRSLARGELVVVRGALGIRLSDLADPDPTELG